MKIPATQLQPNMLPLGTYNLTVTGTNWTTTRAVASFYKDLNNNWRMKFNIVGSVSSGSRTSYTITIAGVSFPYNEAVSFWVSMSASSVIGAYTDDGTSTIYIEHGNTATTGYGFSGDVEISSKPTFIE